MPRNGADAGAEDHRPGEPAAPPSPEPAPGVPTDSGVLGYEVDADAVAAAIVSRLLAGGMSRPPRGS